MLRLVRTSPGRPAGRSVLMSRRCRTGQAILGGTRRHSAAFGGTWRYSTDRLEESKSKIKRALSRRCSSANRLMRPQQRLQTVSGGTLEAKSMRKKRAFKKNLKKFKEILDTSFARLAQWAKRGFIKILAHLWSSLPVLRLVWPGASASQLSEVLI